MDLGARLVALEQRLAKVERSSRLSSASLDNTALQVKDDTGSLRAIVGQQADGTSGIQVVNGPPPPAPSTPIVASVLGGVTVSWDGQLADGATIPLDWSRIEVHASTTPVFDPLPSTLQGTIETAQGATVVVPTNVPVYVRLLARNTSGAASPSSTEVGPYGPAPVVADALLDGIVTTTKLADDAVTAAKVATGAIDADALAAAAVTAAKLAADAVTSAAIADGAIGSTEISDGAITTPKLTANAVTANEVAANAVTAAKLAANAVIAGKIDAGAVTAGTIAAAAVQAGNLAAAAVQAGNVAADGIQAGNIAANAVTARELSALSVTAGKIAANAITTSTLAAGSVDATALKADAITGKTITGGTITGSLFQTATSGQRVTVNESGANKVLVYDATGRAVGELSPQGLLLAGSSGAIMQMDPNSTYPNLRFTNASGSNQAFINVVEAVTGDADLGLNSGTFTASGYSDMMWRTFFGRDFWAAERIRNTSQSTTIGGRIFMDGGTVTIGYEDATGATQRGDLLFTSGNAQLRARFFGLPPASNQTALYTETAAGHTGYMLRLYNNDAGTYRLSVDLAGNTTIGGVLSAPNIVTGTVTITPAAAYTPTSTIVSGLNVAGTTFRGYATANTTVPGYRASATPAGAGVTGVSVSNVTSTGLTVWVNRENTTATTINWMVIGS
ncbi:hypothetical protein ACH4TX_41910 [Streptomyces sp. NPDC021098]|uniref:hypothetical protein n=1 Tax=unclassified Streptomyces TaxID=2593676 RepID=UPI0037A34202